MFDCCDCQTIIKMNICNKRNMNSFFYLCECFRRLHRRHSAADNVASCCLQCQYLGNCRLHILCLCICHRLNGNRISSANLAIPNLNYLCLFSSHIFSFHTQGEHKLSPIPLISKESDMSDSLLILASIFCYCLVNTS